MRLCAVVELPPWNESSGTASGSPVTTTCVRPNAVST